MSVIRVNKTANYTVMSNTHFKERGLSLKAKGLLSLMLSLPDNWDYSVRGLTTLSKDGKDSVMSALAELENYRYLVRHRTVDSKGRFSGIQYDIYEQPQQINPDADKPILDNEHAENPQQLNKKELNNNIVNTKDNIYIEENNEILKDIRNDELRNLYSSYITMRKHINAPISLRGLQMLINRCERLSNFDVELQKALLEAAIINEWKNVYLPNEQDIENNTTLANLKRIYSR
jgi:hypothetical protein